MSSMHTVGCANKYGECRLRRLGCAGPVHGQPQMDAYILWRNHVAFVISQVRLVQLMRRCNHTNTNAEKTTIATRI